MEAYKQYIFCALGTDNDIQLWDFEPFDSKKIFQKIEQYEAKLSYYRKDSFLSQINKNAGISYSICDQDVLYLMNEAFRYYQMTKCFNLLLKPVQQQYMEMGKRLTFWQRQIAKGNVNMNQIKIQENRVMLAKKGMQLDFGGIAKGFLVDKVVDLLKEHKVPKGLVNFGGDIYAWNQEDESFHIGIKNPFVQETDWLLIVTILNESVSTSGVYERHHQKGLDFHHIIDPRTMKPSNSELMSVSIIGKTTLETDVLATSFLILGMKQSLRLMKQNRLDCKVIFITKTHEVYCTNTLQHRVIDSKIPITYV